MDTLLKVVLRAGAANLIHVVDCIARLQSKAAKMEAAAKGE